MSEEKEQPSIKVIDIAMSANLIDIAFQRGAFKASEAREAGAHYEKLVSFVKYIDEANAENKKEQ